MPKSLRKSRFEFLSFDYLSFEFADSQHSAASMPFPLPDANGDSVFSPPRVDEKWPNRTTEQQLNYFCCFIYSATASEIDSEGVCVMSDSVGKRLSRASENTGIRSIQSREQSLVWSFWFLQADLRFCFRFFYFSFALNLGVGRAHSTHKGDCFLHWNVHHHQIDHTKPRGMKPKVERWRWQWVVRCQMEMRRFSVFNFETSERLAN